MYISDCLAYENIEVKVEAMDEHMNLNIRSLRNGYTVSVTLSGVQVATIATALIETLTAMGEVEDSLGIFGGAVRIGGKPNMVKKEAA